MPLADYIDILVLLTLDTPEKGFYLAMIKSLSLRLF
jgi:hypothetical protein